MPRVRCKWYNDAGSPIDGGCRRGGACDFLHPSHPDFEKAPKARAWNNTSSAAPPPASGAGQRDASHPRKPRASVNNQGGRETTSTTKDKTQSVWGDAWSNFAWGKADEDETNASSQEKPAAQENTEGKAAGSDWDQPNTTWGQRSTTWGQSSAAWGEAEPQAKTWGDTSSSGDMSTSRVGAAGAGEEDRKRKHTTAADWGATKTSQDEAAWSWSGVWNAEDATPAAQDSATSVNAEDPQRKLDGPQVKEFLTQPRSIVLSPLRDFSAPLQALAAGTDKTYVGLRRASGATSPARSDVESVAGQKRRLDFAVEHPNQRMRSSSPISSGPDGTYTHGDFIKALSRAVASQIELDEAETAQTRNRRMQHSKAVARIGVRGEDKLKKLHQEQSLAFNSARKKRDAAVRLLQLVARQCPQSPFSLSDHANLDDHIASFEETVDGLGSRCKALEAAVLTDGVALPSNLRTVPPAEGPSALAQPEPLATSVHGLSRKIRRAERKVADLEVYFEELQDNGHRALEEQIQKAQFQYKTISRHEEMMEDIMDMQQQLRADFGPVHHVLHLSRADLLRHQRDLARRNEEHHSLVLEHQRLSERCEKFDVAMQASSQMCQELAEELAKAKAMAREIEQARSRETHLNTEALLEHLREPLARALHEDMTHAIATVAAGLRESIAVFQKNTCDAVWGHIQPIVELNSSIQDLVDENTVAAKLVAGGAP